ncbi:MAG: hypothetical protein MNPFHGCM_01602 [Gemmatimonadaceae bacterium]|nr:hypothetical protein [Gemmatimonadaceae bacterium]
MRRSIVTLGVAAWTATAHAQGTLSTQGFGYPSGGLSARAISGGAGFAEFDATSTRNPASLLGWGRSGLYFQYDPEFRSVDSGTRKESTVTARFPLIAAGFPIGSRATLSLSATTLLDRTWETLFRSGQRLGEDSVAFTERVRSTGGIADMRLASAYAFSSRFAIGAGLHAIGGENRLSLTRTFDDSLKYGTLRRNYTLGFQGSAVSLGAVWRPIRAFALAASWGHGGRLEMKSADTVLAAGDAPGRYGIGARFDAIPGVSLAASYDRTTWSGLQSLGSASLQARDGTDIGVGADLSGPRMRGVTMMLHAGIRSRDLPFAINGVVVRERQYAAGATLPIGGPRAAFDIGLVRAGRSETSGIAEHAWILSMGFSVRP